jgi:oligopeptide transport system substrate-binding protein
MKKAILLLITVALLFSVFAGCSKDEKAVEAEVSPAAAEPVVFRLDNGTEPESLDPAVVEGVPEHNIHIALFEGLVTYNPKTLGAEPGVAKSWEVSDDALTWTFHLREDAVWSDGVGITAQQFVGSWLRFMAPETAAVYAYLPAMIIKGAAAYNAGEGAAEDVAIRALDDYTFQFELTGPAPYALGMLTHYAFSVVPLHAIEKYGDKWTRPENMVSNGPFNLKSWTPQDKLVVEKSTTYWDRDAVRLDEIVFFPIDDQNTATNMYLSGEMDWLSETPPNQLDKMKLDKGYVTNAAFIMYYYQFNQTKPPFDDVRVRKAFTMAIDRQELVDQVTRGGQFPAYGLTPPLPGLYPAVVAFEEDYDEARALLAEAGYPGGKGFPKTSILYNTSETHKNIAQYVQQKWSEVLGVDVEIENQEWATYLDNKQNQNFEVARAGWQGDYVDPNTFLTDLLFSGSGNNDGKYASAEFDALLAKAATLPDGQERYDVLAQAEQLAIGEDCAVMPFYYYSKSNWIDTDVWGGWFPTIQDMHPFKNIYKK